MTENDFITWIKGFVQGCDERGPTEKQWATIRTEVLKLRQSSTTQNAANYYYGTITTDPTKANGTINLDNISSTNKTILNG